MNQVNQIEKLYEQLQKKKEIIRLIAIMKHLEQEAEVVDVLMMVRYNMNKQPGEIWEDYKVNL
jgi:hypothetical protein